MHTLSGVSDDDRDASTSYTYAFVTTPTFFKFNSGTANQIDTTSSTINLDGTSPDPAEYVNDC